jgi:hypothetical protein
MVASRGSSELMQSKSVYKSGAYRGVSHQSACVSKKRVEQSICWQHMHVKTKECIWLLATCTSKATPADFKDPCLVHTTRRTQVQLHRQAASLALHQLCCSLRLLVTRSHGLYVNLAVRRDYSSPGRTGSMSTSSCTASTRLPAAAALHRLRRMPPRRLF